MFVLIALTEMFFDGRRKGIKMLVVNAGNLVELSIAKFGITNDISDSIVGMSKYSAFAGSIIPYTVVNMEELVGINSEEEGTADSLEKGLVLGTLQVMDNKHEGI